MRKSILLAAVVATTAVGHAGSAFDDVSFWFRAGYNPAEQSGSLNNSLFELYNAVLLGDPSPITADSTTYVYGGRGSGAAADFSKTRGNKVCQETVDVAMPYAGRVLRNRQVVHFLQPSYDDGGVTKYCAASLFMGSDYIKGFRDFENDGSYTIVMRYKFDGYIDASIGEQVMLFRAGYDYSKDTGINLEMRGPADNFNYFLRRGKTGSVTIDGMTKSEATRLSPGKWIDFALVVDGATVRLYSCAEGGQPFSWSGSVPKPSGTAVNSGIVMPAYSKEPGGSGTAAIDAYSFLRGSVQQFGVWYRALSEAEVYNAFCDGYEAGDVVRFGVENDSNLEFAGYDKFAKQSTSATSADQSTDWRHLPPALNAGCPSASIAFSAETNDVVMPQSLRLKTTGDSSAGTVSVSLNGRSVTSSAALAPGATAEIDLPLGLVRTGENTLVITRVDAAGGDLECDCLVIGRASGRESVSRRDADDVFADAYRWSRIAGDRFGNGYFRQFDTTCYGTSRDFASVFHAIPPLEDDPANEWIGSGPATNMPMQVADVVCPASGKVLSDAWVTYFRQPTWLRDDGTPVGHYGGIVQDIFPITNSADYAAFVRVKVDPSLPEDVGSGETRTVGLFGLGFEWSNKRGLSFRLTGTDRTNFAVSVCRGTTTEPLLVATQDGDPSDRLSVGKWMDVGVSVSNGWLRVYTCVEGGTGVIEQGPLSLSSGASGAPAASSAFFIGTGSGGAAWSQYASAPLHGAGEAIGNLRGWLHEAAVWARSLSKDEMAKAFAYPNPDLVRLGASDGSAGEFDGSQFGGAPALIAAGSDLAMGVDVSAAQKAKNQRIRLVTPAGSGADYAFSFVLNGSVVTNWSREGTATSVFAADELGIVTADVHRDCLVEGRNTLVLMRADADPADFVIDAFSFGNGGKSFPVHRPTGAVIIIR